jgi:3-phenylpropionate/trans-cinnamate dioxygenase ferredoxin subunit
VAETRMRRLCDSNAVCEGQLSRFSLEDLDIVVSRFERKVVALEDRCGHMAAPMSMGKIEGCALVCPLHDAAFDLTTGGIVRGARLPVPPAGQESNPRLRAFSLVRTYPLKVFPIAERDGAVFIEIPDSSQASSA